MEHSTPPRGRDAARLHATDRTAGRTASTPNGAPHTPTRTTRGGERDHRLRRASAIIASAALGLATLLSAAPASASAGTCVGGPGCYPTVQAAVNAAPAGSTVRIGGGTFRGGVTIGKSLTLVGAGESRTRIRGGGPVITVEPSGTPTVEFEDLSISGGLNHGDGVHAVGGGISAPSLGAPKGASMILRDVLVTGNRTAPTATTTSPAGLECTHGTCAYALSAGAGIATNGDLTLDHVTVRANVASGPASDADGGGVWSDGGNVTITSSTISANRAEPQRIGIYAEGGGLFARNGTVSIVDTRVTGNAAELVTTWPVHSDTGGVIDQKALGGGVKFSSNTPVTISGSVIDHNRVTAIDPVGEPLAFASGIEDEGTIAVHSSSVSHNTTDAVVATSADVGFSGDTIEIDHTGTLRDVRIIGNRGTESSSSGPAQVATALSVIGDPGEKVTATGLVVSGNTATSRSAHGSATAYGAGVLNNALLDLSESTIQGNHASAYGKKATAQGGGIWNGVLLSGPPVQLVLHDVTITHNAADAPHGTEQGGGIFSTVAFTADHVRVAQNLPENCFGTGC